MKCNQCGASQELSKQGIGCGVCTADALKYIDSIFDRDGMQEMRGQAMCKDTNEWLDRLQEEANRNDQSALEDRVNQRVRELAEALLRKTKR